MTVNKKETTSFDVGFQLVETEISTLDPAVLEFSLLRGAIIFFCLVLWCFCKKYSTLAIVVMNFFLPYKMSIPTCLV